MFKIVLSTKLGELRLTKADLARMTHIRRNTLGHYYNNFTDRINLEHLDLICEALECEPQDILKWEPNRTRRVEFTASELIEEREKERERMKALRR